MASPDAYVKGLAATVCAVLALVVLTARHRRGAVPLAIFLSLIALNQGAETMRALVATDAERLHWFQIASIAASLDPFVLAWFTARVAPSIVRHPTEGYAVGAVSAGLALAAGWGFAPLPDREMASHIYPFVLAVFTAAVYITLLLRAASSAEAQAHGASWGPLVGALLLAALPSTVRPFDEGYHFVAPIVHPHLGITGLLLVELAILGLVAWRLAVALRDRRVGIGEPPFRAFVLAGAAVLVVGRIPHFTTTAVVLTGGLPPDVLLQPIGRLETPIRWLLFGALGSAVLVRTDLLDVPIETRRRAARLLVALAFLVAGGAALVVVASAWGERPLDRIYLVVLAGSLALSQGFRRLVDAAAGRLYGVPIPADRDGAESTYRSLAADVLARGGVPARDAGLERARRSLGIDRATAHAIEAVLEQTSRVPLSPGRLVAGRYQVERLVGRGGFGRAFVASDLRLGRPVVLKEALSDDPAEVDAALREARLVGALAHPHVLTIHDVLPRPHGWILVTEYAEGGTLAEALLKGRGPIEAREAIARGLLDAVATVHQRGIVHGDIKPGNVLLTSDGQPKLADFGLARSIAATTAHAGRALGGGDARAAPEVRRGERPTPASDVYALGTILLDLFEDDDAWHAIAAQATRAEPGARYADAAQMRAAAAPLIASRREA